MSTRQPNPSLTKETVYSFAREIFGNPRKVYSWMDTPNILLGNMRPKDFLEHANTEDLQLVYDELSRIDQGVF
jgi:uncharacterized protein (DUF2384 family)